MYPPPPEDEPMKLALGSPRKLQERQKAPVLPKSAANRAAILLLDAFVHTNHPLSLVSGIPRYADRNQDAQLKKMFSSQASLAELETAENFSGKGALEIGQESCFWSCLRPSFLKRFEQVEDNEDENDLTMEGGLDLAVGPRAWPILDWFVKVLEKEQELCGGWVIFLVVRTVNLYTDLI